MDLGGLETKLSKHLQSPPTPKLSPLVDDSNCIDRCRIRLARWGLTDSEIDCARRWDQKALHHTAESIHMRLLSECVDSLARRPASLQSLYYEYDKRMIEYDRRRASDNGFDSPQSRAQRAVDMLVSEMSRHDFTAEQMARYRDSTFMPNAMMEVVAEHCELKLRELRRKKQKSAKRMGCNSSGRICLRSTRVMERDRRKEATRKRRGPLLE
jgi:hypothetical protein